MRAVIEQQGLCCSLYTDRGSHYWHTPQAGGKVDKVNLTQFGRAMTLSVDGSRVGSQEVRDGADKFSIPAKHLEAGGQPTLVVLSPRYTAAACDQSQLPPVNATNHRDTSSQLVPGPATRHSITVSTHRVTIQSSGACDVMRSAIGNCQGIIHQAPLPTGGLKGGVAPLASTL